MLGKKFGLNFCVSFCEKHVLKFFNSLHRTQVSKIAAKILQKIDFQIFLKNF
jgi:hypothetical protein